MEPIGLRRWPELMLDILDNSAAKSTFITVKAPQWLW